MAGKRRPRRDSPSTIRRKELRQQTAHLAGRLTDSDPRLLGFIAEQLGLPLRVIKAYDAGYGVPRRVEKLIHEGLGRLRDAGYVLEVAADDFGDETKGIFHGVRLQLGT